MALRSEADTDMLSGWSRIEVGGRPAEQFAPAGARFTVLWLHSHAEESAAENEPLTARLAEHKLACLAPRLTGESWLSPTVEAFLLNDCVPERHRGVAVAGLEIGGQAALRLGMKYPSRFRVVAGLGSAIDFHDLYGHGTELDSLYASKERARQDTATLHMHPSEWPPHIWFACDPADPWFRGNDRLHEKLRAYGVPHTADLDSSGSDYFEALLKPMFEFIAAGLDRESRRLM